ncbi:hypothetical protein EJ110_NYTH57974 [Nymphaea thermarum]|nr:hypothetical protein EJ110_NYTH57974 [Nymphaea thermarum]
MSGMKTHFEQTMAAKFLAGLSPKYEVAKVQMLTGAEIPDLVEAISLSQPQKGGGTFSSQIPVGSARAATPLGETPSLMNFENSTVTMSKVEYDKLMAQRSYYHDVYSYLLGHGGFLCCVSRFHDPPLVYTRRHASAQDCPPVASQHAWYHRGRANLSLGNHSYAIKDMSLALTMEKSSAGRRQVESELQVMRQNYKNGKPCSSSQETREVGLECVGMNFMSNLHFLKALCGQACMTLSFCQFVLIVETSKEQLHIVTSLDKGRGLVSQEDIFANCLIHSEVPYATVLGDLSGDLIQYISDINLSLVSDGAATETSLDQFPEHRHECLGVNWPAVLPAEIVLAGLKGHRKRHIIEEDEPINKTGKYITWEEDDNMVMSWIMNSVQPQIASTITYYTTAKEMWDFLKQTYSQDKNYAAAKDQMLTGSEIPELSDAYNRLSRLAISLSQPTGVTPASALAVGSGHGHDSTYSARGRGMGRGTGGRGRFQCTYCGKIGHLEDRCWDKHGRPSSLSQSLSQGRNMVTKQSKSPAYSSMGSAQTATPTLEESSPSIVPETVSIDKVEYEQFLAHKASQASASTAVIDRAFSVGPTTSDSGFRIFHWYTLGDMTPLMVDHQTLLKM